MVAAVRLTPDESIALDGRLDEPAWQRAVPASDFLQQDPDNGAPATEPTEVRVRFDRHRVEATTANQRVVAASGLVETGEFFSGRARQIGLTFTVRPRAGPSAALESEWNDLDLAEGHFRTSLYRAQVGTQFSPWISLGHTVQYDSVSRLLGWQSRFRWILRPGNDVYVVYTHNWWDDRLEGWRTLDHRAASKVIDTHRF